MLHVKGETLVPPPCTLPSQDGNHFSFKWLPLSPAAFVMWLSIIVFLLVSSVYHHVTIKYDSGLNIWFPFSYFVAFSISRHFYFLWIRRMCMMENWSFTSPLLPLWLVCERSSIREKYIRMFRPVGGKVRFFRFRFHLQKYHHQS